jgi:hypothetical protein
MTQLLALDEIVFDEEPHTYTVGGKRFVSVTQAIRTAGFGPDFSAVPLELMEYAQDRGRLVHMACQYYNDGDLDLGTVDEKIRGYVEAYIDFRLHCSMKVSYVEKRLAWVALGLAGTPDMVCFINGRRAVVDLKTSQNLGKDAGLQTAGYQILHELNFPNQMIYGRYGLRLGKDGKFKLIPHERETDLMAFRDCLDYAKAKAAKDRWNETYGRMAA